MFKKILIANRGEIAVRVIRACREMGIQTVALFEPADRDSLHVRLADACVQLGGEDSFFNIETLISIAQKNSAEAIHPGYGFLAERADFIRACDQAGIVFIGPPAEVVAQTEDKIGTLSRVSKAGYPTVKHSGRFFGPDDYEALQEEAYALGFPLVVKSCRGGRGRGEMFVNRPEKLAEAVRRAQVESMAVYGDRHVYLESAIIPAHQVGVQIVAGRNGQIIHLGEREGSVLTRNQKVIEESPAPCLNPGSRHKMWTAAVEIAQLLEYQNVGTMEFLVDGEGRFFFTEVKARLQVDHPLSEMRTGVDLVREQIRIAAGEEENDDYQQDKISLNGWAMMARIRAENPWNHFMPSPGRLARVRFPGGNGIRVDSNIFCQSDVPAIYDPLIAKITAWAADRPGCINRLRCVIEDTKLIGTHTNLSLLQQILQTSDFVQGRYDTSLLSQPLAEQYPFQEEGLWAQHVRDLAITAAILYVHHTQQLTQPETSLRFVSKWHQDSRRLPQ